MIFDDSLSAPSSLSTCRFEALAFYDAFRGNEIKFDGGPLKIHRRRTDGALYRESR